MLSFGPSALHVSLFFTLAGLYTEMFQVFHVIIYVNNPYQEVCRKDASQNDCTILCVDLHVPEPEQLLAFHSCEKSDSILVQPDPETTCLYLRTRRSRHHAVVPERKM